MYRTESEVLIRLKQLKRKRRAVLDSCEGLFLNPVELARVEVLNDEIKWLTDHYNGLLSLGVVDTLMDEEGMFCE